MTGAAPSLGGKIAVVTGASRGIGAATANVLASAGAAVVVNYLTSRERAEQVVIDIKRAGGEATAVGCDVTQPGEVASLERFTRETYGAADILVNNAGRANERKRFEELEWEDYQSQIDGTLKL